MTTTKWPFQALNCTTLLRDAQAGTDTSTTATATLDLHLATYNAMTLRPFEKDPSFDSDSAYCGKAAYLQNQMDSCGLSILAVQEGSGRESGLFENASAIRVVAAGTQAGTHGVEIWLSKQRPFGKIGKHKLFFDRTKMTVRSSSPTVISC